MSQRGKKRSKNEKVRAEVFVRGRVQGVFFRANTRSEARKRGLAGWVENLSDGRVRAVVEGKEDKVRDLIDWMRKGPAAAKVKDLNFDLGPAKGEFEKFRVRR